MNKLRNENVELQQRASLASVYSDELESLRERSHKVEKYESEICKLRERIEELGAHKLAVDELKEENVILGETRAILEKQLGEYQTRLLSSQRLDADLHKYKLEVSLELWVSYLIAVRFERASYKLFGFKHRSLF